MKAGKYKTYSDYVNKNKDLFPDVYDETDEEELDEYEQEMLDYYDHLGTMGEKD